MNTPEEDGIEMRDMPPGMPTGPFVPNTEVEEPTEGVQNETIIIFVFQPGPTQA